jgi:hypothetical protein
MLLPTGWWWHWWWWCFKWWQYWHSFFIIIFSNEIIIIYFLVISIVITWNIIITSVTIILSEEAYCMQTEHVIRSISLLWTNQLRFFCQLLFLLTWSYVLFLSNFSLSNLIFNWLVHNSEIDRMTCSVCIQYASSDRMMVTLVMMMFQVMTILTFFFHYNFFK